MVSGFTSRRTMWQRRTNSSNSSLPSFRSWQVVRKSGVSVKSCRPGCGVWWSDNTSSFIVRWKMELKSFASCMAREICRRCLNKQMNAAMEADPTKACNTGLKDLNPVGIRNGEDSAFNLIVESNCEYSCRFFQYPLSTTSRHA